MTTAVMTSYVTVMGNTSLVLTFSARADTNLLMAIKSLDWGSV